MRVFKVKAFARWAKKERITDKALKTYANALFQLRDEQVEVLIKNGNLSEVKSDGE